VAGSLGESREPLERTKSRNQLASFTRPVARGALITQVSSTLPFSIVFFQNLPETSRNHQKPFYFSFAWKSATHIGYPQWLINVNHHFPQAIEILCSHRIRAVEPRRWEQPRFSLAAPEGRGVCDGRKRRARCSSCWG
jgi:hypothetical protein